MSLAAARGAPPRRGRVTQPNGCAARLKADPMSRESGRIGNPAYRRVTILSVSNVGISFGATELLKNITFTVAEGERWGIIGRNGAGKTSIFNVITGDLPPTVGSVARKPGLRHALLDQHRAFEGATTIWQAGAAAWREVMALEERIAEQAIALGEMGERVTDDF